MVDAKLELRLRDLNPQWERPVDFAEGYKPRAVFEDVWRLVKERQVLALCGLRRVGKTTLLKKLMAEVAKTTPQTAWAYVSFDDWKGADLLDVVRELERMNGRPPQFLFLDEVQKLPNWAEQVKLVYDRGNCKIIVTGSESLFIRHRSRESLAGRIYEFEIKPLTFREYLDFAGQAAWLDVPVLHAPKLERAFDAYLLSGGFPELIGQTDPSLVREFVRSALLKKILADIRSLYPVKDLVVLESLLERLMANPGMLVDFVSLSKELSASRQTISAYVTHLENAHLAFKLYNYSKNKGNSQRKLKKYYPGFFTTALVGTPDAAGLGKVVETACALHTGAKFFWRNPAKDEIDLILTPEGKPIVPVEVKYRNDARPTKALAKFCRKYPCDEALLITKNTSGTLPTTPPTKQIPAREFLLDYP